jgi:hypothetical protein
MIGIAMSGYLDAGEPDVSAYFEIIEDMLGRMYDSLTTNQRPPNDYLEMYAKLGKLAEHLREIDALNYMPASAFLDENQPRFPDYNAIRKALKENPGIRRERPISERTGRPVGNRMKIHAGDLYRHLQRQAAPDPLDLPAHVLDAAVQETQRRKAEEQLRKPAG